MCNGVAECLDGSDEMGCPQNGLDLFFMKNMCYLCFLSHSLF